MLLEILANLNIPKIIAFGHSWGSMTILRAASKQPELFEFVFFGNMPFQAATKKQKVLFRLQHLMLIFRNFYTKQAAKSLFAKKSLKENRSLFNQIKRPMDLLTNKQIKQIDKAVIVNAEDATDLIINLQVKALTIKGEEDYVKVLPKLEKLIIKGGHVSPLENPKELAKLLINFFN